MPIRRDTGASDSPPERHLTKAISSALDERNNPLKIQIHDGTALPEAIVVRVQRA